MTKTTARDQAAIQLAHELQAALLPVAPLLGLDIHDRVQERARGKVASILAILRSDDDKLAAGHGSDLMHALWGHGDPPPEWWRSPLGLVCAKALGSTAGESISHSVASAMLGTHRGTVASLVHRGTLDRHPDGGVLRSSVLLRLARQNGTSWIVHDSG